MQQRNHKEADGVVGGEVWFHGLCRRLCIELPVEADEVAVQEGEVRRLLGFHSAWLQAVANSAGS